MVRPGNGKISEKQFLLAPIEDTRRDRNYLWATLAGSLFLLAFELLMPLGGDNEIYQSMAGELFRYHWLPYLGSWDQNFPGIVYIHWLSIALFGDSALGFRVFDVIVHLGMSWMFYRILRRWLTPQLSLFSVLLYNFHYLAGGIDSAGQRDSFAMCFLLAASMLLYRIDEGGSSHISSAIAALGAGAAFMVMVVIRPTYAPFTIIGIGFLWMTTSGRRPLIAWFAVGAVSVLAALVIPYLLVRGGIEQLYLTTVRYNLDIWGRVRFPIAALVDQIRHQKFFLVPAIIGIALCMMRAGVRHARIRHAFDPILPMRQQDRFLILGYGLSGLVSFLVMGKYWANHLEPVLLILIPFGALGIATCIALFPNRTYRVIAILFVLTYSLLRVFPHSIIRPVAAALIHGDAHPFTLNDDAFCDTGYVSSVDRAVASYIDRTAPRGERYECASGHAGVRWRLQRRSSSRFTTFYPLMMTTPRGEHPAFQVAWRREYIDSLRSIRPYYIALNNVPIEVTYPKLMSPLKSIHEIPGFDSEIFPHYRFDTIIGGYTILKRIE